LRASSRTGNSECLLSKNRLTGNHVRSDLFYNRILGDGISELLRRSILSQAYSILLYRCGDAARCNMGHYRSLLTPGPRKGLLLSDLSPSLLKNLIIKQVRVTPVPQVFVRLSALENFVRFSHCYKSGLTRHCKRVVSHKRLRRSLRHFIPRNDTHVPVDTMARPETIPHAG